MDEIAADFISAGIDFWNKMIEYSLSLLQLTPETYNQSAWNIINTINDRVFVPVAVMLIIYFFLIGFMEEIVDFHQALRIETMFKAFLRVSVASGFVLFSLPITKAIFQVGANLVMFMVSVVGGVNGATQVKSRDMINYISTSGDISGVGYILLHVIVVPVICVMAIMVFYTILTRMMKILCIIPFGSIAFASGAGGKTTGASRSAYIKFIICCSGEAAFIMIAILVSTTITNNGGLGLSKILGIDTINNGWNFSAVFFSEMELIITLLLTVGIIKGGQTLLQKALAL